jgi:hypothetical protein
MSACWGGFRKPGEKIFLDSLRLFSSVRSRVLLLVPYLGKIHLQASLFIGLLFIFSAHQIAAETVNNEIDSKGLIPYLDISDPEVSNFAQAVGYIFALSDLSNYFSENPKEINLVFISKPSALVNGVIDRKYLKIFDKAAQDEIVKFRASSDECAVLPIEISDTQSIILSVNTSENGLVDLDKTCFLLSLAFFSNYSSREFEMLNKLNLSEKTLYILEKSNEGDN